MPIKFRADTVLASFVVAIFASFLTALAVMLVKALSISVYHLKFLGDLIFNLYILFFLAGFIFFRGSALAAWLLYRHDVTWGYHLEYRRVLPIFALSFIMAVIVFSAIYTYITSQYPILAFISSSLQGVHNVRAF